MGPFEKIDVQSDLNKGSTFSFFIYQNLLKDKLKPTSATKIMDLFNVNEQLNAQDSFS